MSDGLVAMHCELVPRIASVRFSPPMAEQPEPGSRLLHAIAVLRKYMQRVRWSRLPLVVAPLRSCADAPESRASESTRYSRVTVGAGASGRSRANAPDLRPPPAVPPLTCPPQALHSP